MTYLAIREVPVKSPDMLRITVHEKTLFFLYSEEESDEVRVLAEYPLEASATLRGVMLNSNVNGAGRISDVTWKSISISHRE